MRISRSMGGSVEFDRRLFCIFVYITVETVMDLENDRLVKRFDHLTRLLNEFIFSLVILARNSADSTHQ
jgi:hypothetical protein